MRWRRLVAFVGLVVTSLGALGAPAAGFHDDLGSITSGCTTGRWGFNTAGRPVGFVLGGGPRAALWREDQSWRLRFTADTTVRHYTGTVTAADGFSGIKPVALEGKDQVVLDGSGVKFSLRTGPNVDGFNFRPGCSAWIKVTIYKDGSKLGASRILIGRLGNAYENPVTITRIG